jgi:hypothetical protein
MQRLQAWCDETCSADDFEARLVRCEQSEDAGEALLAEELLPMWKSVRGGGKLPFGD